MTWHEFLKYVLGAVGFLGLAVGTGWVAVKYLAGKWVDEKFEQRMAAFKHSQAMELAHMRVTIEGTLSGAVKLQTAEFEMLPEAWARLVEAYNEVSSLVSPAQSYVNVEEMNDEDFKDMVAGSKFSEPDKRGLLTCTGRGRADEYQRLVFWYRERDARRALAEFHDYVNKKAPFLPSDIKASLMEASDKVRSVLVAKRVGYEAQDWKMQSQSWERVEGELKPLYKSVEIAIQDRLREHGAIKSPKAN